MGFGQGGDAEPGIGNQAPCIQPIELHRALSIAAVVPSRCSCCNYWSSRAAYYSPATNPQLNRMRLIQPRRSKCSPGGNRRLDAAETGMAAGADERRQGRYLGGRRPGAHGCVITVANLSVFACLANSDVPCPWDHGETPEQALRPKLLEQISWQPDNLELFIANYRLSCVW